MTCILPVCGFAAWNKECLQRKHPDNNGILGNVVNLAGSGKKLTKSTDIIYVKSELTKRSLQSNGINT